MKNMLLPKRLKDLRKSCGYDQEFVASHLNISRQAYSHYETGRNNPPMEAMRSLADLYKIPAKEFLQLMDISDSFDYRNIETPVENANMLSAYLEYLDNPYNNKKLQLLTSREKKLLFYFGKLSEKEQEDILDFAILKAQKNR